MTEARAPRRFGELSDAQRKFIGRLNDDDVATLEKVIELFRDVRGMCRLSKWIIIGTVSAAILVAQGINAFSDMIAAFLRWTGKQ